MFDHLLESSHRDDSNKWLNIGFGQEIKELASIEIHFTHLIWCSVHCMPSRGTDNSFTATLKCHFGLLSYLILHCLLERRELYDSTLFINLWTLAKWYRK